MSAANLATSLPVGGNPPDRRSRRFDQAAVLSTALGRVKAPRDIAVFDLDSTLLDNRPRQARIVRELGVLLGDARLQRCAPEQWVSWAIEDALANCGLSAAEVARVGPEAKAFWRDRFFTSEYCRDDVPIAGATEYLAAVLSTPGLICYVTGRHTEMGPGSIASFERAGFPIPDGKRIRLLLKPEFKTSDDAWKVTARQQLMALGDVRCAFDNEPSHINSYREGFPDSYPVHLDTDHSGRPVEVLADIPSVRDFRRQ